MSTRLRIGVIGCGFFARNHLHAWRELPGVELAAVCDADAARARAAAREFAVPGCHAYAGRMLATERLDAVDIDAITRCGATTPGAT